MLCSAQVSIFLGLGFVAASEHFRRLGLSREPRRSSEVMAQEVEVVTNNDHTLNPVPSDDEDSDFPEFEFPVDGGDGEIPSPSMALVCTESGKSVDVSPQKMPPAHHEGSTDSLLARVSAPLSEEPAQPEVSKHVVTEAAKPASAILEGARRKVLQSNPSFKSLVNILGGRAASPTRFESLKVAIKQSENEELQDGFDLHSEAAKVLEIPQIRRLSLISRATQTQSKGPKTPERAKTGHETSVSPLGERFSRNKLLEEAARALSGKPAPRNFSEKRIMADRSRSPISSHMQEQANGASHRTISPSVGNIATPKKLSSPRRTVTSGLARAASDRSVSPVVCSSSWKDTVYSDMPKDKRPNLSIEGPTTPPPRFLTPTRAAALKAVKPPLTPNQAASKGSLHTAFGITTPVRVVPKKTRKEHHAPAEPDHAKNNPTVTECMGFNFRTDQRAERRKDYNAKVEERLKVKEVEKKRQEQKVQEEKEAQLRELRKSLNYKANPVPRFYQGPAPSSPEIRKPALTRAKSPNFRATRRSSVIENSSSRTSPLRSTSRLLRCPSLESNSGHSGHYAPSKTTPRKQPFRPI